MIIEQEESTYVGVLIDKVEYSGDFWVCSGKIGSNKIGYLTEENEPLINTAYKVLRGVNWIFGATSYDEILAEIALRGYQFPTQQENK